MVEARMRVFEFDTVQLLSLQTFLSKHRVKTNAEKGFHEHPRFD